MVQQPVVGAAHQIAQAKLPGQDAGSLGIAIGSILAHQAARGGKAMTLEILEDMGGSTS
jgi:hypothetical protein